MSAAAKPTIDPFSTMLAHARLAGQIGPLTAAAMAASFGWSQGSDWISHIGLAICFALCSFIVGFGFVFLRRALRQNMRLAAGVTMLILTVGVTGEFIAHLGFFSAHRAATVNKATVSNASYASKAKAEGDAVARADGLRKQLEAFTLTRSKAEAESEQANKRAHKWFAKTSNCTTTLGPETRKFCTEYFAAVADAARADQRADIEGKLAEAEAKRDTARGVAGAATVITASADAQSDTIASVLTISLRPDAESKHWVNIGLAGLAAAIFVSFGLLNMIVWEFSPEALQGAAGGHSAAAAPAADPAPRRVHVNSLASLQPRPRATDTHALKTMGELMRKVA
jgi:hypothetical protein